MATRLGTAAVMVAAVVAVVAGCANVPLTAPVGPAPPSTTQPSTAAAPATAADQRAADVAYAQTVLPHVGQGLELTALVPGRAADPDLARLAFLMDYADVEEQGQLIGQLHLWRSPVPGESGVPLMRMPGMADRATLDRLRALTGPAFDRAWLAVMIAHHQGGIDLSRDYLARGGQALAGVAQAQVEIGERQVDQMRALRSRA